MSRLGQLMGRFAGRGSERGAAALPADFAMGMFMVFFALFAQVAVWQYTRGSLRAAAMEAARAEAPFEAPAGACERRFDMAKNALLGGSIASEIGPVSCEVGAETVRVSVSADLEPWLPISPGWSFTVSAVAVREHLS